MDILPDEHVQFSRRRCFPAVPAAVVYPSSDRTCLAFQSRFSNDCQPHSALRIGWCSDISIRRFCISYHCSNGYSPNAFCTWWLWRYHHRCAGFVIGHSTFETEKRRKEIFLPFSAVGLIDLLNVAFLLLKYYPICYSSVPNSAPAADFSLIMIPAILAPVALLLHFYALRNSVLER